MKKLNLNLAGISTSEVSSTPARGRDLCAEYRYAVFGLIGGMLRRDQGLAINLNDVPIFLENNSNHADFRRMFQGVTLSQECYVAYQESYDLRSTDEDRSRELFRATNDRCVEFLKDEMEWLRSWADDMSLRWPVRADRPATNQNRNFSQPEAEEVEVSVSSKKSKKS